MASVAVDDPPAPEAPPAPHKPFTTFQVYGTLAALALGIVLIAVACLGAWLYYVHFRSER